MTGMPAVTMASMVRAERTPPSTLTACAYASREEAAGVLDRFCLRDAIAEEGHVAHDEGPLGAARHRPRVVQHLVDADAHGRVVAEHDHAQRVADQDERDAGLVHDAGRGVVVGRDGGEALALLVHASDVRDGDASVGLAALMSDRSWLERLTWLASSAQ